MHVKPAEMLHAASCLYYDTTNGLQNPQNNSEPKHGPLCPRLQPCRGRVLYNLGKKLF